MSNLLNDLENFKSLEHHQQYTVEMGFEKIKVTVPMTEARAFETTIHEIQPNSNPQLLAILKVHRGTLEEKCK